MQAFCASQGRRCWPWQPSVGSCFDSRRIAVLRRTTGLGTQAAPRTAARQQLYSISSSACTMRPKSSPETEEQETVVEEYRLGAFAVVRFCVKMNLVGMNLVDPDRI